VRAIPFLLILILMNPLSLINTTLEVSSKDLRIEMDRSGSVKSIILSGRELNLVGDCLFWVRDLSNFLLGRNLLPKLYDGVPKGWNSLVKGKFELKDEEGKLTIVSYGGTMQEGIQLTSELFPVRGGEEYAATLVLSSSFGYIEEGKTTSLRVIVSWYDSKGDVIREGAVLIPEGTAYSPTRFTNLTEAPKDAVKASLKVLVRGQSRLGTNLDFEAIELLELGFIEPPSDAKWIPVKGTLTSGDEGLIFSGRAIGLELSAIIKGGETINLACEVKDEKGEDRALEVAVSLPVKAFGWLWWDDARRSRQIVEGEEYSNIVNSLVSGGYLPVSLYPLAAITDRELGLCMAVPLDRPRIFRLCYDNKGLSAVFSIGLSSLYKFGRRANFSLEIFGINGEWGFRSAIAKYYGLHPDWFKPKVDLSSIKASWDLEKYGISYFQAHFQFLRDEEMKKLEKAGVYMAQYVLPWEFEPYTNAKIDGPAPNYLDIWKIVEEESKGKGAISLKAKAALFSAALTATGDKAIAQYRRGPNYRPDEWVPKIPMNVDPNMPGYNVWSYTLDVLEFSLKKAEECNVTIDGVQLDNFMGRSEYLDSEERIPYLEEPPTYDPNTFRPAVHLSFSAIEYLKRLREWIDQKMEDPGLTGNFIAEGMTSFGAIYLDAIPFEANSVRGFNWGDKELLYRRFIALRKPLIVAHTETRIDIKDQRHREEVEHFLDECLFYGVLAQFRLEHYQNLDFLEVVGELLEKEAEISIELMRAGWRPITMARAETSCVWVERYGDPPSCFFTVYNSGKEEVKGSLIIEFEANLVEIWKGRNLGVEKLDNKTKVAFSIGPRETLVFKALSRGIDLSVEDLKFEGDIKADEKVKIVANFLVQGMKEVETEVALVVDGTFEEIKRVSIGRESSVSFSWLVKPGKHVIELVVDPSDEIPEINEENNRAWMELSVPSSNLRWMIVALISVFFIILILILMKLKEGR